MEFFRAQEDPLGDRLEELQSQAMVAAQRTARRKIGGRGSTGSCIVIAMVPGGEDWMRGSERLLTQAGIRRKYALALYSSSSLLFALLLLAGPLWLQRDNPDAARCWAGWSRR